MLLHGPGKNKEVFTITNSNTISTNQESQAKKAGRFTQPSSTNEKFKTRVAEGQKELNQILNPTDAQVKAIVKNTNLNEVNKPVIIENLAIPIPPGMNRPWTKDEIKARAHEMVEMLEDRAIELPETLFQGASASDREKVRNFVYDLGIEIFRKLESAEEFDFFSDGDGTMYYKNPIMVNSTCSFASAQDRYWNTILAKSLYYLGTPLTVLTARPGAIAGQSLVGTEGPISNSKNPNATSFEEISACIGQERAEMGSFNVNIRGLNGALQSDIGKPLKLTPACQNFNKLFNFLDKEFNLVDELLKIRYNDGDSVRVLEFKAVPAAFKLIPDLSLAKYEEYMTTAKKAREEKWPSSKFVEEVNKLKINFPPELLNPPDKPDIKLLDPRDSKAEAKLTEILRDGHGGIVYFTPHCIDSKNVYRQDVRAKFYNLLIKTLRDPKTKAWLEAEFGIPQDCDVITVNSKDVSHISDFSKYPDLSVLIKELDAKGTAPKHKNILVNISDNNQFYMEVGATTTKDQMIKRHQESTDRKIFSIMRGDSPSTDAPAIAQAVISGGVGVIVRGLMNRSDVGSRMVDLLSQNPADGSYANEGHPDCLNKIGEDEYQHLKDGRIKTKKEWAEEFADKYKNQILQIDNIHLNNAAFAFLFTKFLEREKLPFDAPASEIKTVSDPRELRYRTLTTPDIGFLERGIDKYLTKSRMSSLIAACVGIPIIGKYFKIENSRPLLNNLMNYLGYGLMGAGLIGMPASFFSPKVEFWANAVQRVCAGVGNFVSGITRGLRAPTRYPAQFIGEMCHFAANLSHPDSFTRKILWAVGNGLLQLGRAGGTMTAENTILDNYKKGTEEKKVEEIFGDQKKMSNLRQVANDFAISRSYWIEKFKPFTGQFVAETVSDVIQGLKMTYQFLTVKGYRHGVKEILFKNAGFTKTSMTSGKDYTNVASVSHLYATSGILGLGASLLSIITHKLNNKWLDWFTVGLANFIPTIGIVGAARNVKQDQHGHIRLFTDVVGRVGKFDPETAGWWQLVGGQIMAASSWLLQHPFGVVLQMFGLGSYLKGIAQEFNPIQEMGAINTLRNQQEYSEASTDLKKTSDIVNHNQYFFGRGKYAQQAEFNTRAKQVELAKPSRIAAI